MKRTYQRFIPILFVLTGNLIYTVSVKLFLLTANLMSCGTTGLGLVMNHLFDIPLTTFIFIFNMLMLLLGWCIMGKKFALTTVFSSLFYPVALEVLNRLWGDIYVTDNILLNVLFAGMGMGLGLGIVIRGGASTGGMDIPPLVLHKLFRIPVSMSLWVFDFLILTSQLAYHTLEDLLYGVLLLMGISMTLNKVLLMGSSKTEVKIISTKAEKIRDAILSKVDRGVTMLHGEGGYLHLDTEVILSVVSNHEMVKIERLARDIDPDCFMIVNRVVEVWGRGFSHGKLYAKREEN
ncbi:MAG: YitT family protein [Oscillospiraceae bacterium]|nr:YitT family protein [Oscillospiraceae bacterium]